MNGARSMTGRALGIKESRCSRRRGCDLRRGRPGDSFLYCGNLSGDDIMSAIRVLSLGAVVYLIAGCSGMSEQACVTADWRTVGFEDGTLGRSEAGIGRYRQQCSEHGVAPDLESYRAGHAEGGQVYCRESKGFAVGHSGAAEQGGSPAGADPSGVAG